MPNCLVIDNATGLVINRIVADPEFDMAPDGCRLELEPILPAETPTIDSQTPATGG